MKISKKQGTYYLFVGGVSPYMNEEDLKSELAKLGPISELTLKKRPKHPFYNLGYGIVSTQSHKLYLELVNMHFYQIGTCKLEFKDYKDPKDAIKQNTIDSVKFSLQLQGLVEGITDSHIIKAIQLKNPLVKLLNIVLKKNYADGCLTGEAKIIFDSERDVTMMREMLPLKLTLEGAPNNQQKRVFLREKNLYQTDKAMKKLSKLQREGLIPN